jgi:hypothetical protein
LELAAELIGRVRFVGLKIADFQIEFSDQSLKAGGDGSLFRASQRLTSDYGSVNGGNPLAEVTQLSRQGERQTSGGEVISCADIENVESHGLTSLTVYSLQAWGSAKNTDDLGCISPIAAAQVNPPPKATKASDCRVPTFLWSSCKASGIVHEEVFPKWRMLLNTGRFRRELTASRMR